ncbi:hypothetical protein OSTOST_19660 [Ostertagia ostertagi]
MMACWSTQLGKQQDEKNQLVDVNAWLKLSWHETMYSFNGDRRVRSACGSDWIPSIFRISCRIAVAWFPFDVQECFLKFGSWTFDGSKLNLDVDENGFDLSSYIQNGEWELTARLAVSKIHVNACARTLIELFLICLSADECFYYWIW